MGQYGCDDVNPYIHPFAQVCNVLDDDCDGAQTKMPWVARVILKTVMGMDGFGVASNLALRYLKYSLVLWIVMTVIQHKITGFGSLQSRG